jgi:hypothetical protein
MPIAGIWRMRPLREDRSEMNEAAHLAQVLYLFRDLKGMGTYLWSHGAFEIDYWKGDWQCT